MILRFNFLIILIMICVSITNNFAIAENQINSNIADRLTRIEETQKTIISEIKTRFEAVDKRFEAVDRRFEAVLTLMNQRFESLQREMNLRFESLQIEMDKRFEAVDKRIDALDKRIDSVDKRIDQLSSFIIAVFGTFLTLFIAIFTYAVWDRRSLLDKGYKKFEQLMHEHNQKEHLADVSSQKKLDQVINIMKQMSEKFPEMRQMMQTANLL